MPRYAQLVMGPAGSGKSTFCDTMVKHCEVLRRVVHVVNLDPAAEHFQYPVYADIREPIFVDDAMEDEDIDHYIRELISVDDAMEDEDLHFGPNGGLVFCMEYLAQNFDWLQEQLDDVEDDYVIFDCPGQIELYTHIPVMRQLVEHLQSWNFNVCGVFLIDAQFMIEASKFVSGVMSALSTMVNLEIPHVNIITKLDLLNKKAKKELEKFLDPDMHSLLLEEMSEDRFGRKFQKLNESIASMIDDYSLVKFFPLDITNEDIVNDVLIQIDTAIQYGEDMEPKEHKELEKDGDDIEGPDLNFFGDD